MVVIQGVEEVVDSAWKPSHAADDSGAVKTRAREGRPGVLHRRGAIHPLSKAVFSPPSPLLFPALPSRSCRAGKDECAALFGMRQGSVICLLCSAWRALSPPAVIYYGH